MGHHRTLGLELTPPLRILGIDPGGTTGFAWWVQDVDDPLSGIWGMHETPASDATRFVDTWIAQDFSHTTHIACETFTNSARVHSTQPQARQIFGYAKGLCAESAGSEHPVRFYPQSVSSAKSLAPNELLKRLGLYTPLFRHSRDATRHALFWLHCHHPEVLRSMRQAHE